MAVVDPAVRRPADSSGEPTKCKCMCGKSADGKTRAACGKLAIKGKAYCVSCQDHYEMEF